MTTATLAAPSTAELQQAVQQANKSLLDQVLAATEKSKGLITLSKDGSLEFGDFEGVARYARMLVLAGCVPTYKEDTVERQQARTTMAIMLGRRVGLPPEEAVASIYVVNNRPQLFGDAPLAICRQHPSWVEAEFREWFEVDGKPYTVEGPDGRRVLAEPPPEAFGQGPQREGGDRTIKRETAACCQVMRKGAAGPVVHRFSMGHAVAAGLFGRNSNLYGGYPQRMLRFRARGYALRDNFSDALKGLDVRELMDPGELLPAESAATGGEHGRNGNGNGAQKSRSDMLADRLGAPPPTVQAEASSEVKDDHETPAATATAPPQAPTAQAETKKAQAAQQQTLDRRDPDNWPAGEPLLKQVNAAVRAAGWPPKRVTARLAELGLHSINQLSYAQADKLLEELGAKREREPGEEG